MSRVRIVGGEWRRRFVSFHDAPGLRPTPDAVRETLFNWLGQDLTGLACLDLFAGSGVLGFEAASRGAARATLVERDQRVFSELRQNAETFRCDRLELVRGDALKFLASTNVHYDVVFLDPPYHRGWLEKVASVLPRVLARDAQVYAEAEVELPPDWLPGMGLMRKGCAGQVHFHLFGILRNEHEG
ncbi:MAG: 16S rRNA (guanine(966)-N(2))-methyltransferase RsmD [Rhodocyclaceae bacterium]|nr:16S rRNA (guanine(966)-N(2))-methyltransferase RsmD [Rhodocyclaceae bacterium]